MSDMELMSDIELVKNFQKSHDQSFLGVLCQRHLNSLLAMAITILKDRNLAEDMVQSAFVLIINKISGLQHKNAHEKGVKAWMMTVLVNACKGNLRDEGRRRHREKVASEEKILSDPNELIEQDKRLRMLLKEMDSLPEMYRVALHMHYQQNMPFKEMASVLSVPEKTLQTRALRGVAKLREQLLKAGVTASAIFIASVLKSNPMEAASSALQQEVVSLVQQSASLSQRVAVVQGGGSVGASSSSASQSLLGLKWIMACLVTALGTYAGIHFFPSEEPLPSESVIFEDLSAQNLLNIHWSFDVPELPPELVVPEPHKLNPRFKYVADEGRNNSGALEGINKVGGLLVNIPEESLPLKVTFWAEGPSRTSSYINVSWVKWELRTSMMNNLNVPLKRGVKWANYEIYFTKNSATTYRIQNRRRLLIGIRAYKRVMDEQLVVLFSEGARLDDLDIQTIGKGELPDFLDEVVFQLNELETPVGLSGEVKVPWPKHLKSPFGKGSKPNLYFNKKSSILKDFWLSGI